MAIDQSNLMLRHISGTWRSFEGLKIRHELLRALFASHNEKYSPSYHRLLIERICINLIKHRRIDLKRMLQTSSVEGGLFR